MAKLAIKGHKTLGKEVIETLEMLGGKNVINYDGSYTRCFYFLDDTLICSTYGRPRLQCYTLEEFIEKFPYKVGYKALAFGNKCTIIDAVWDESIDEVVYTIKLDTSKYTTTKLSNQLQPYKEQETMEEIIKIDIPKGYEFAGVDDDKQQVVFEKIGRQYPKTYEECYNVLGRSFLDDYIEGHKWELIMNFQKLLVCRDAYWKIAGDWDPIGRMFMKIIIR